MHDTLRVGVVDSGCGSDQMSRVCAARAFHLVDDRIRTTDASDDGLNHGSSLLDVIAAKTCRTDFAIAQVFSERMVTTAIQLAAAIDWLCREDVSVINLSVGLRGDRDVVRQACAAAVEQGIVLCASSPARGEPVFPAYYPGVLRMTGDARCSPEQFSRLDSPYADYGGHVLSADPTVAGASAGCAHMTGHIARYLENGGQRDSLRAWLDAHASFHGVERRYA